MKQIVPIIIFISLGVLGYFAFRMLFPDDVDVIRGQLSEMATEASFEGSEAPLTKVSKAGKLAGYFTVDAQIEIEPWGYRKVSVNGRAEIREVTIGARTAVSSLKISVDRVDIVVADNRSSARVLMSVVVQSSRQEEPWYQDMDVEMERVDGDWLISRIRNREFIKQ